MNVLTRTCTCEHIHIYLHTQHKHTYIHTYIRIYIHTYVYTYMHAYTYVYTYIHVHIYIHVHTYVHYTYTHYMYIDIPAAHRIHRRRSVGRRHRTSVSPIRVLRIEKFKKVIISFCLENTFCVEHILLIPANGQDSIPTEKQNIQRVQKKTLC